MGLEDKLRGLPWYGQVGVFALVAGVLFYLAYGQFIKPKKEEIAALNTERDALIQEITKGETLKARFIEFEAELKRLENQLERLKRILPESEEVADLYSRIQQEGAELGLAITNFRPGAHIAKEYYDEWPINMNIRGNYHTLAKFFERIGKLYRIINVNDVDITAFQSQQADTLTASCIATTFIYREEAQAASGSGAP